MNILVTGANGQLGNSLRLAAVGSPWQWLFTDVADASDESLARLLVLGGPKVDISTARLDITDVDSVGKMLRDNEIDVVINCAAYTAVDAAESHPEEAARLNVLGPQVLAEAVRERDGLLVHISTDYVFGEVLCYAATNGSPCASGGSLRSDEKVLASRAPLSDCGEPRKSLREEDPTAPLGVYGKTKLEGERAVLESGCKALILRTAWLYSEFGKNFCRTMLSLTETKPEIRVVNDQFGTPTYARDLAEMIVRILSRKDLEKSAEIYHFTDEGCCSWYDFAAAIAEDSGHRNCRIHPCSTADYPTPARRPSWSVLDKSKIASAFDLSIPDWRDSLKRCLQNLGCLAG